MNKQGIQGVRQVRVDLAKVEKRESPRFPFSSAVMVENYQAKTCHVGRMVDCSRLGMQFEAGVAPDVGAPSIASEGVRLAVHWWGKILLTFIWFLRGGSAHLDREIRFLSEALPGSHQAA